MIKFKIGFTIDAKTLFAYLSQALPTLENLSVEEIIERPVPVEEKFLSGAPVKVINKGPRKPYKSFKHPTGKRITDFIEEYLSKIPSNEDSWKNINKYIGSLGFGRSSINSSLKRLCDEKKLIRLGNGTYKLQK